ncbi:nucleoside-diphosphate kinase [Paenibacillus sp. HN-1]|uniref:nucleoside-diphosphate kinase n=1 Tax=Paenibacillus TaxID=44249 RepID=UPI001CA91CD1|nr:MULTISPECIES: nucleoside-diphosphate kinase [Paenibacillus]MBY9081652.1 nucleoside-diphosphate kinase [Paenibacillus sp. CGMCC 1.18879]MBY9083521.1 nucleoside-diphosphate kinase [Paenibacillus sinensis]
MEKTFLMIKPDGVQRGLIGRIVARLEDKGFKLVTAKLTSVTEEQAKRHYAEHEGKDFFPDLVSFITSGPVFAMVWEADDVIALSRLLIGKTKVGEALPGTIRGDFASHTPLNLIHGSDSPESAAREIANFFAPGELNDYDKAIAAWT